MDGVLRLLALHGSSGRIALGLQGFSAETARSLANTFVCKYYRTTAAWIRVRKSHSKPLPIYYIVYLCSPIIFLHTS